MVEFESCANEYPTMNRYRRFPRDRMIGGAMHDASDLSMETSEPAEERKQRRTNVTHRSGPGTIIKDFQSILDAGVHGIQALNEAKQIVNKGKESIKLVQDKVDEVYATKDDIKNIGSHILRTIDVVTDTDKQSYSGKKGKIKIDINEFWSGPGNPGPTNMHVGLLRTLASVNSSDLDRVSTGKLKKQKGVSREKAPSDKEKKPSKDQKDKPSKDQKDKPSKDQKNKPSKDQKDKPSKGSEEKKWKPDNQNSKTKRPREASDSESTSKSGYKPVTKKPKKDDAACEKRCRETCLSKGGSKLLSSGHRRTLNAMVERMRYSSSREHRGNHDWMMQRLTRDELLRAARGYDASRHLAPEYFERRHKTRRN
ncbi:unnamed protein product [Cyprideis torosa]|uniref:Uncharacterized protein n=1 Tax=Cyprideis torosa TaxID=163714 RepID=A0A7R8WJ51_9CRUS|nr:unnamed protein product [Cyprideis torosa]CAG0894846.1 unnamed protein product [Cyprideis torosa]